MYTVILFSTCHGFYILFKSIFFPRKHDGSGTLILCNLDDIPPEFTFSGIPLRLTFLFETLNKDPAGAIGNHPGLRLDSSVYIHYNSSEGVHVEEAYRIKSGPLFLQSVGLWTNEGVWSSAITSKWERRANMGGIDLIDPWMPFEPFTVGTEDQEDDPEGEEKCFAVHYSPKKKSRMAIAI